MKGPTGFKQIPYLLLMAKDYVSSYYQLFKDYGDIVTLKLPWKMHIITHPELFEKVLTKDFQNYTISNLARDLKPLLGEGLITSSNEEWNQNKRLVWPFFSQQNIQNFEKTIHKQIEHLLSRLPQNNEFKINPTNPVFEMTYQIISNLIFSKNIETNSYSMEKAITKCVEVIQKKQAALIKLPYWIPTPLNWRFNKSKKLIQNILTKEIQSRLGSRDDKHDLLNLFLKSQKDSIKDYQNIKDQIITLFITGHETTANTIMWCLYLLSTHPDVYQKWTTEIRNSSTIIPALEEIELFPYTSAIIKETMRLYPAAPVIPRNALKDDQFFETPIKKGDEILLSVYNLHRSPKLWDRPDEFIPERFLTSDKIPLYQYLPFGRGKRACIGERLAISEITLLIISLGRQFDFSYQGDAIGHLSRLTLRQDKPLRLSFKRVEL